MSAKIRICIAFVLVCATLSGGSSVLAGESDGVSGYSMRLKNKDITIGDDAGGGSGGSLVYGVLKEPPSTATTISVARTKPAWVLIFSIRSALFPFWMR